MGTVREYRAAWFAHLLAKVAAEHDERGSQKEFARIVGTKPSLISQINGGKRRVGDSLARRIEKAFGMGRGQMDGPLKPEAPITAARPFDQDLMHYLIEELETVLVESDLDYEPKHKADKLLRLYSMYTGTGERPTRAVILQFLVAA